MIKFVEHQSFAWVLLAQNGYRTAWIELGIACMIKAPSS